MYYIIILDDVSEISKVLRVLRRHGGAVYAVALAVSIGKGKESAIGGLARNRNIHVIKGYMVIPSPRGHIFRYQEQP